MSSRTKRVIYTTEGKVIRKLRKEANMSMSELGRAIGLSDSSISQWENGRAGVPPKEHIAAICKHFEIGEKYFYEMCRDFHKEESNEEFIKSNLKKLDETSVKMLRAVVETMLAKK